MQNSAHFIVKMTATPKTDHDLIELTENELLEDRVQLLKREIKFNQNIETGSLLDNEVILQKVREEFKIIKEKYNDNINEPGLIGINPAMLIQVDNDSKNTEKNLKFAHNIELIIKILEKNNLSWVKYFDQNDKDSNLRQKENYTLRDISKDSSPIDVIIFKVGPATGWNIPRARMLVQLRHVSSTNLSIQTLGRIKRNPKPGYDFHETSIAKKYFLYSNIEEKERDYKIFVIKEKFSSIEYISGNINAKSKEKLIDEHIFNDSVKEKLNEYCFNKKIFIEKYDNIFNQFKENKFIIAEEREYGLGLYVSKLKNLIEVEIFNKKQFLLNKKYLTNEIFDYIIKLYHLKVSSKYEWAYILIYLF
ncbi:hypothetical protein ONA03_03870 [Mycoplasmopsis cynos]|nr:DEAD/DEAH box helicase family protein [Mycoplasmopsis cynos]WAM08642.1 hypothetical protein ONA03_03870 [Mycoplasmopsis cynos]